MKKKMQKRILGRLLAKDLSDEELKLAAGGTVSRCGGGEYDDTDAPAYNG